MNQKKHISDFDKMLVTSYIESGHCDAALNEDRSLLISETRWIPTGVISGLYIIFFNILQELADFQAFLNHMETRSSLTEHSLDYLYIIYDFDSDFGANSGETNSAARSEFYSRLNRICMLMEQDLGKRISLKLSTRKIRVLIRQLESTIESLEALNEQKKNTLKSLQGWV